MFTCGKRESQRAECSWDVILEGIEGVPCRISILIMLMSHVSIAYFFPISHVKFKENPMSHVSIFLSPCHMSLKPMSPFRTKKGNVACRIWGSTALFYPPALTPPPTNTNTSPPSCSLKHSDSYSQQVMPAGHVGTTMMD